MENSDGEKKIKLSKEYGIELINEDRTLKRDKSKV
jgi:hypothetical protein